MIPESTVVVGRAPEKMREAAAVLDADGFTVIGVFSEVEALSAIADHEGLLAVVAGGSVSPEARERLRSAAAARGAVIVDAFVGHGDPADHFRSVVMPWGSPLVIPRRAARSAPIRRGG